MLSSLSLLMNGALQRIVHFLGVEEVRRALDHSPFGF
jgi:hypothetical protein